MNLISPWVGYHLNKAHTHLTNSTTISMDGKEVWRRLKETELFDNHLLRYALIGIGKTSPSLAIKRERVELEAHILVMDPREQF